MSKWPKMAKSVLLIGRHWCIRLDGDKSAKEFPISKMLLLNIGHELTYNYDKCQNAKNGYIL